MNLDPIVQKERVFHTPHFSSYADRVCIAAAGSSETALPCAELYCNSPDGQSRLYDTYMVQPTKPRMALLPL